MIRDHTLTQWEQSNGARAQLMQRVDGGSHAAPPHEELVSLEMGRKVTLVPYRDAQSHALA